MRPEAVIGEKLRCGPKGGDGCRRISEHPGPFTIEGIDEDGNVWSGAVSKDDIARAFADRRRVEGG